MTEEANAAIARRLRGRRRRGLVNDSHGDFRNMLPDLLDARAQVIQGKPRTLGMVAGVELGVDGVCMVGYHSRAGGARHPGPHHQQLRLRRASRSAARRWARPASTARWPASTACRC